MAAKGRRSLGSDVVTRGVRVRVTPSFLPERSDADHGVWVFQYRVRISNESDTPVTVLSRRWVIVDADGERQEVRGDGVIGQQPTIMPGQEFQYSSYCPLGTSWGTMEGQYTLRQGAAEPADLEGTGPLDVEPLAVIGPGGRAMSEGGGAGVGGECFECAIGRFYLVAEPATAARD